MLSHHPSDLSCGTCCRVAWAGIRNTYYWLDPRRRRAGVLMTQILPFADPVVLDPLDRFEAGLG